MATETKKIQLTIALAPRHIGNEEIAIKNKLKQMRLKPIQGCDGIMVKWDNLQILEKLGTILDEQPYIFWRINFDCVLFSPEIGKISRGMVQKILTGYFLAKIYDSITVTVTIPDRLRDNYISKSLTLGQEIYFRIDDAKDGFTVTAELDEECIDLIENDLRNPNNPTDVYAYSKDFEY